MCEPATFGCTVALWAPQLVGYLLATFNLTKWLNYMLTPQLQVGKLHPHWWMTCISPWNNQYMCTTVVLWKVHFDHVKSKVRSRSWGQDTGSYSSKDCHILLSTWTMHDLRASFNVYLMHACFLHASIHTFHSIPFRSVPLHYIPLHSIALHYITLHYIHCMHAYMPTCIDA